jgi:predicted N-acetyltransferase YhbS
MTASVRAYGRRGDFDLVGRFLIDTYLPGRQGANWLQPEWEYMHCHPSFTATHLDRIGIWEDGGEVAGVVHYEGDLGEAYFQVSPRHSDLKAEMLDYALERLSLPAAGPDVQDGDGGDCGGGGTALRAYIHEHDAEMAALAEARGFRRREQGARPAAHLELVVPVGVPALPAGFRLKSLADDNDIRKIHRTMWRGFDHAGEPPEHGLAWRVQMQSGPNFRKDLNIVVEAPDGNFVSYAGVWFECWNRIALVEPVATDPDYRRMGLGRAAVLEGLRRCAECGARVAYVGSWQPFYLAMGFKKLSRHWCWVR